MGAKEGKRPVRLPTWRLTSRDQRRLERAASLYGGNVQSWEGRDGEYEVITEVDALPIALLPGHALSQFYELWGQPDGPKRAVSCLRRCDGEEEIKSDGPCICLAENRKVCQPTTRLSVLLTDIPGVGCWRLETRGWNAAAEMSGVDALLERFALTGVPLVPATLRIDPRESRRDGEVRRYPVPVIDIEELPPMPPALAAPGGRPRPPALPSPGEAHVPLERPAREGPSVAEGLDAVTRSASETPSSRVPPIGPNVSEVSPTPIPVEEEQVPPATPPAPPSGEVKLITEGQRKKLFALARGKGHFENELDEFLHKIAHDVCGVDSLTKIPRDRVDDILALIKASAQSDKQIF